MFYSSNLSNSLIDKQQQEQQQQGNEQQEQKKQEENELEQEKEKEKYENLHKYNKYHKYHYNYNYNNKDNKDNNIKEINTPSSFDLPDSLLVSLFSFQFLKFTKKKRYRIIANGIGTFLGLVLYQHAISDMLIFYLGDDSYSIYSVFLFFGSITLLVISRSLESLVQYEPADEDQNAAWTLVNDSPYLCGYVDKDLETCCGIDCTFKIKGYHFYILRIIRYNLNAILICACWSGSDNFFNLLTQRVMERRNAPRLGLDIFFLIVSNIILLYEGQFSGQMGVFSHEHAVETLPSIDTQSNQANDSEISNNQEIIDTNVVSTLSPISQQSTIPPPPLFNIESNLPSEDRFPELSSKTPKTPKTPSSNNFSIYTPPTPIASLIDNNNKSEIDSSRISLDTQIPERESSIIERGKIEASLHIKVILTLIGVLIFWFSLWDLCWNYPREAIIRSTYNANDDDVDDVDGYTRRHISPRVEIYLLLVGILYCISSSVVLILTGGLFSFVKNETQESRAVHRHTLTKFEKKLKKYGITWNLSFDSLSIQIGDKIFMPIRLIEYNILGAFSVIAWIGFDTMLTSFENLLIYYYFLNPLVRYSFDIFEIIIAVILLTYLEQFGNQFGGRDNLSTKHEIVSIDNAFHTSDSSILQSNDSSVPY